MELSRFYEATALQLPEGIRDWSEYAIALNDAEPGFEWQENEQQRSRNDFTNDRAYVGTRFLLRLVREAVPSHLLKITHAETGATHILALLPDGRYICDCCMGGNVGIVCRHYFVAWTKIPGLPFHISLIRPRWYQDPRLDVSQTEIVTLKQQTSRTFRFSAMTLPAALVSNPLSSMSVIGRNTPAPPTGTIPQRAVYSAIQADVQSLIVGVQTLIAPDVIWWATIDCHAHLLIDDSLHLVVLCRI
ncbi:hypothetical protein B0H11DRAFT_2045142 [Mycena galericulata]|nr:hypothetical protein B0H11DRAFT_2045142 [Mycena galericulata]